MLLLGHVSLADETKLLNVSHIVHVNMRTHIIDFVFLSNRNYMYLSPPPVLQFLSHHGGSGNAMTTMEFTTFYFDVAADHLMGALDRYVHAACTCRHTCRLHVLLSRLRISTVDVSAILETSYKYIV